jgi:hypothetical protein
MFVHEKFNKSNQSLSYLQPSKNISQSNKYHQRNYQKNKPMKNKTNKCEPVWKKQNSYIYNRTEKENDKNNSNYIHPKKNYFDNKKRNFKHYKKNKKTELEFDLDFIDKENELNFKTEQNLENYKFSTIKKEKKTKDEKNNSIDHTTTATYSNSNSVQEEINNNIMPTVDNLIITKFKSGPKYLNKKNVININDNEKIIKNLNKEKFTNNDLSLSWSMKSLNFYKINSNSSLNSYSSNEFSSFSSSEIVNINKLNDTNNIIEPFNKYNSINQDFNQLWINPIAENTEILSVKVKLSKGHIATFRLRRFDDLFLTVKLFCEINSIDEKLMKPIIIKSLCALNNIYQIFNACLDTRSILILKRIYNLYRNTFI